MYLGCAKLLQKRYHFFLCHSANWTSRHYFRINLSIMLFCNHNVSAKKEAKWQLFAVYLVNTKHSSNKCSLSNLRLCNPSSQVAKSVNSPLLDWEMGVVFVGFRPVLEVLAKHSWPCGPVRGAYICKFWRLKWVIMGNNRGLRNNDVLMRNDDVIMDS